MNTTTPHSKGLNNAINIAIFALIPLLADSTLLTVALPTLQQSLHLSNMALFWIFNTYWLAVAIFCAPLQALAHRIGDRKTLLLGLCLCALGNFFCTMTNLIGLSIFWSGRILYGAGSAAVFISIRSVFKGFQAQRAPRSGVLTLYFFMLIIPPLSGFFCEWHHWESVFAMGYVFPLLAFAALLFTKSKATTAHQSTTKAEGRVFSTFFHNKQLLSSSFLDGIFYSVFLITLFFLSLHFQGVLGMPPLKTAFALLPLIAVLAFFSLVLKKLIARGGPQAIQMFGYGLLIMGFFWLARLLPTAHYAWIAPGLVLLGMGFAGVMTATHALRTNAASSGALLHSSPMIETTTRYGIGFLMLLGFGYFAQHRFLEQTVHFLNQNPMLSAVIHADTVDRLLANSPQALTQLQTLHDNDIHFLYDSLEKIYTQLCSQLFSFTAFLLLVMAVLSFFMKKKTITPSI